LQHSNEGSELQEARSQRSNERLEQAQDSTTSRLDDIEIEGVVLVGDGIATGGRTTAACLKE
jgi:predicted phosphoribosyltransferase